MNDIAKLSGVSRQVVSAIFASRKRTSGFSEETRKKVLEIAERNGYRPNRACIQLKKKRHGLVALLCSTLNMIPPGQILEVLTKKLLAHDFITVIEIFDPKDENNKPRIIKEDVVDVAIVFEPISDNLLNDFQRCRLPCLAVNSNFEKNMPKILFDDTQGTRLAVEKMRQRGRKNIAYLPTGDENDPWNKPRMEAMNEMNKIYPYINCTTTQLSHIEDEHGIETYLNVREILERNPGLDGVILNHLHVHAPLIYELRKNNIEVPRDMSVATFFALPWYGQTDSPDLSPSGMNINQFDLAEKISDCVCRLSNRETVSEIIVPYEWIDGKSL